VVVSGGLLSPSRVCWLRSEDASTNSMVVFNEPA
jgi:hypothetical protein